MDAMVLKYLGLSAIVYGLHFALAFAQLLLGVYLIANGVLLLQGRDNLGSKAERLGLIVSRDLASNRALSLAMLATGIALFLPLLGVSYWLTIIACPVAILVLVSTTKKLPAENTSKIGRIARSVLILGAVLVCGFTLWEAKDLVNAAYTITYKAAYWRGVEVAGWQQENNPNAPKIGEIAPDFELTGLTDEDKMRLSDYRGDRPVVLLFGSFT